MVAYSFKARFAPLIIDGSKSQTIRADRRRHARQGEELQLYTAMRTKHCRLIGRARCLRVTGIRLDLAGGRVSFEDGWEPDIFTVTGLDVFAVRDGFADWADLCAFWRAEHEALTAFSGVMIQWDGRSLAP